MDELGVPGIDMGKYVFGDSSLPGPRREPMPGPPEIVHTPEAEEPLPWYMQMVTGLLPMAGDWLFGAAPAGETDLRHSGDPQSRERAEQQAADAASAKRQGVEPPTMPIFKGMY